MTRTEVIKTSNRIIEEFAKQYFNDNYNGYLLQDIYSLMNDYYKQELNKLIDSKYYNNLTYKSLQDNIDSFLAGKNYLQYNKTISNILNQSFTEFKDEAKVINSLFNDTWMDTEINYLRNATSSINKWMGYDELGDDYLIQYVATHDELTRDTHYALDGITLPRNDPFWQTHTPPWAWNCRCTTKAIRRETQTDTNKSHTAEMVEYIKNRPGFDLPKGLANAPRTSGKLWSDDHTYLQVNDLETKKRILNSK